MNIFQNFREVEFYWKFFVPVELLYEIILSLANAG